MCEKECPKDLPYENSEDNECIKECNLTDLFNGKCKIKNNSPETKDNLISYIRNQIINGDLNSLLLNVTNGEKKDLILKYDNFIYQITSTENQNINDYDNISTIKLGECENKLKEYYNISKDEPLLIFKIDIYEEGILIPTIEYEVYNSKTKKQLNLTVCKYTKINILLPAIINEENEFKHNSSSEYYNDICYPYTTENGTDISLNDRKNEFNNNNMSLCESNCDYKGYNSEKKKVKCDCDVKIKLSLITDIITNKDNLLKKIVDIKNVINLNIMKCFKTLFSKEGLKNNIGNYILLSIIFINLCLLFIFLFKGYKIICDLINKIAPFKQKITINNTNNIINKNNNNINNFKSKRKRKRKRKKKKIKNIQLKGKVINIININKDNNKRNKNNKNNNVQGNNNNKIYKDKKNNPPPKNKIKKNKGNIKKNINIVATNGENKNDFSSSKQELNERKIKNNNNTNLSNLNNNLINRTKNNNRNENIKFNDYELNTLDYKMALILDKRNYIQYYISLLKRKQLLIFTFYTHNDYNSKIIKICLFFFSFSLYYTVNALFFNDSAMHKIYEGGFNFIYQIPQIIYSSLICSVFNIIVTSLSLSEKNILSLKTTNKNRKKQISLVLKCLKIKFFFFFLLKFLFLIVFWYYISCFCAVYRNTQIHLIKDTLISFGISMLYPFGLCLFPGIFRIPSLRANKSDKKCLYKFSKILQLI